MNTEPSNVEVGLTSRSVLPLDAPTLPAGVPPLPARMVNDYVYCPRLACLEWVQGEWAESADTVEGRHSHRRVDKASGRPPPGKPPPDCGLPNEDLIQNDTSQQRLSLLADKYCVRLFVLARVLDHLAVVRQCAGRDELDRTAQLGDVAQTGGDRLAQAGGGREGGFTP